MFAATKLAFHLADAKVQQIQNKIALAKRHKRHDQFVAKLYADCEYWDCIAEQLYKLSFVQEHNL